MKEGSYQFIHVDAYGREGSSQTKTTTNKHGAKVITTTKSRSAKEILAEQWREKGACPHIKDPEKPNLLYGVPPREVLPMIEEWADQARDAQGRKLRKDGHCALIGVASLPREMEDNFSEFAEDTLAWLKEKYRDRLKSVVVHDDEAHPHLHFTVVPRIGERFDDIHEGLKAKNNAKKENKKAGEQNLAYIEAMRCMQDEFSKKVAMSHGLTRIGPGRRRLTRAQWKAEKAQAAFFSDAKAQHKVARKNGYKVGLKRAEEEAKVIGSKFGNWLAGALGGFHRPTAEALEQIETVQQEAEKKKKKADAYATQAKKWADERVAAVGNQITLEKIKSSDLEKDSESKDKKLEDQAAEIRWYQKKFGKVSNNNLPKNG
jgi:hypothetical protein